MKANELKPGMMFLRKENIAETLVSIIDLWNDKDTIPCIHLSHPEAVWWVSRDDEVFA